VAKTKKKTEPILWLKVGHMRYAIYVNDRMIADAGAKMGGELWGATLPHEAKIILQEGMSPQQFADTLLHEALHGVFNVSGLQYDLAQGHPLDEEAIIRRLVPALLETLRDNPKFTEIIATPLEEWYE
jgi:hypothetical protein